MSVLVEFVAFTAFFATVFTFIALAFVRMRERKDERFEKRDW